MRKHAAIPHNYYDKYLENYSVIPICTFPQGGTITTNIGIKISNIGSMPDFPIIDDIWNIILKLILHDSKGMSYLIFRELGSVSKMFYCYINSFKVYITFPKNPNIYTFGSSSPDPIITINKSAKRENSCCSIYLDLHPQLEKRGKMNFFRMEYHDFHPDLPTLIAKTHNHDITKLSFGNCPFNMNKSAKLYTKYFLTRVDLVLLRTKSSMLDTSERECLDKAAACGNLTHLWDTYTKNTNGDFFSTFQAQNKKGKIVKCR